MNLYYGSRGDEVKRLQTALNGQGYGLSVDGIYGVKTQAAVRDYQSKNALQVDGIVGPRTSAKLYGTTTGAANTPVVSGLTAETNEALGQQYSPSAEVEAAKQNLKNVENSAPDTPDSGYFEQIYREIQDQSPFSYDLASDPLYGQYEAMYRRWGRQAMEDTMGQAASLTGGYGSSYAQTAGQQTMNDWMGRLAELTPEFYDRALEQYAANRTALTDKLDAARQQYGLQQEAYGNWQAERDAAQEALQSAQELSLQEYRDLLDYWLQRAKLENADYQWRQEYALKQLGY